MGNTPCRQSSSSNLRVFSLLPGPISDDEHDLRTLGAVLRDLRTQRHLTLAALAATADVPEPELAAIEASHQLPEARLIER